MINAHVYPSAMCAPEFVQEMMRVGIANDYEMPAPEHCGFTLMSDHLVPETFIQRVMRELTNSHFEYGYVLSRDCMFSSEFLETLDAQESAALMNVVLLLIARDAISLNLWASKAREI